jgi:hypothetical protein
MDLDTMTPLRPSCLTTHAFLQYAHGRASGYTCSARCGRQAAEWAYLYNSQNELTDPRKGQRYAGADALDCYVPLCRSCHTRWDISNGSKQLTGLHSEEAKRKMAAAARARVAADPERWAKMSRLGQQAQQLNKRGCAECELVSTPSGVGLHQRATGHKGFSPVSPSTKTAVSAERSV